MSSDITQIMVVARDVESTSSEGCKKEALEVLEGANGWIRAYNGFQTSNPRIACWVVDWQSTAHRETFLTDEAHASLFAALRDLTTTSTTILSGSCTDVQGEKSGLYSLQVQLDPPHAPAAFSAPVTEIAISTPRRGTEIAMFEVLARRVVEVVGREDGVKGVAWGKVIGGSEADDKMEVDNVRYAFVIGWESVETRRAVAATSVALELHQEINQLAEHQTTVVELKKHEKGNTA